MEKLYIIINSAQKSWQGKEKLWIVFWLWFVALLMVCWILNTQVTIPLYKLLKSLPSFYFNIVFIIDMTVTTIFRFLIIVIVWRCAPNTNNNINFYSARLIAFVFALLTVYGNINGVLYWIRQYHEFILKCNPNIGIC